MVLLACVSGRGLPQAVPEVVLVGQLSRQVLGERMHGHLHPSWGHEHAQAGRQGPVPALQPDCLARARESPHAARIGVQKWAAHGSQDLWGHLQGGVGDSQPYSWPSARSEQASGAGDEGQAWRKAWARTPVAQTQAPKWMVFSTLSGHRMVSLFFLIAFTREFRTSSMPLLQPSKAFAGAAVNQIGCRCSADAEPHAGWG